VAPALWLLVASPVGAADPKPAQGTYCPLPRAGEKPSCLAPAQSAYGEFFAAVEQGQIGDEAAARVEAELTDPTRDQDDFLALSSLAYGYYRLAQQAADPSTDPSLAARLERWNRLLSAAYARDAQDEPFRSAVRLAASDLAEKAPEVRTECVGEDGEPVACSATRSLLEQLDAADRVGVRGALARILDRWLGE
jgi:hypothetical protein